MNTTQTRSTSRTPFMAACTGAGVLLMSAAVLAGTAVPASAAALPESSAAPVAAASHAHSPAAKKQAAHKQAARKQADKRQADKKQAAKAREAKQRQLAKANEKLDARTISYYKLSAKQVKEIKQSKKLANTSQAKHIRQRESHGNYKINTHNGYYGAYQFDRSTWLHNGGGKFASTPDKAPRWAQDYVMYKTHQVRGWSPWG